MDHIAGDPLKATTRASAGGGKTRFAARRGRERKEESGEREEKKGHTVLPFIGVEGEGGGRSGAERRRES